MPAIAPICAPCEPTRHCVSCTATSATATWSSSCCATKSIDTIVHFAAESHVDRSIVGPDAFIETNVIGTHALLKAARKVWLAGSAVPRAIGFITSRPMRSTARSGPRDPAFTETTPYAPNSPYSASKAASDHLVRAYHHTYGLQVDDQQLLEQLRAVSFPEKLIPLMIVNILRGQAAADLRRRAERARLAPRDDHCRAHRAVLERGRAARSTTSAVVPRPKTSRSSTGSARRRRGISQRIRPRRAASRGSAAAAVWPAVETDLSFVNDRQGHDRRYAIDSSKAERLLGIQGALHADFKGCAKTVARGILRKRRMVVLGAQRRLPEASLENLKSYHRNSCRYHRGPHGP